MKVARQNKRGLLRAGVMGWLLLQSTAGFAVPKDALSASAPTDKERVRVQFAPLHETVLSSELSAKVANLPFREGDTFKSGQPLVKFDCSLFRAQLAKAEASAEAARETVNVSERLNALDSIGSLEVRQAAARAKEADAEATAMRVTVEKCTLNAPFPGRVARVSAKEHQFVAPGQALLEIVDTQRLELQMIVPSKWLAWLKVGSSFSIHVDELGRSYTGRVVRLGARIDPVSQSISLAGQVADGQHAELLPGMSGWAEFQRAPLSPKESRGNP